MAAREPKRPVEKGKARRPRMATPRPRGARKRRAPRSRGHAVLRFWSGFQRSPVAVRWVLVLFTLLVLAVSLNWAVQVARKPSELLFPVSDRLNRTPTETWRSYGYLFEKHATPRITAPFLAAIAQIEASGNPIVRTYWRWSWSFDPFDIYRPASSAVGMYQFIDGTFDEARRLCIRNHAVAEAGAWSDWRSCWFNGFYTRTVPSHSIEMASAYLDRQVSTILARKRISKVSATQVHHLAAVIHLCGAGAGSSYAQRRFRLTSNQRCGDHSVRAYLARMDAMKKTFSGLAAS